MVYSHDSFFIAASASYKLGGAVEMSRRALIFFAVVVGVDPRHVVPFQQKSHSNVVVALVLWIVNDHVLVEDRNKYLCQKAS